MRTRVRFLVVWLMAAFILAHGTPSVSATETPEADDAGDQNEKPDADGQSSDHERKHNHGFFVSTAAHCEDISDPNTPGSDAFPVPADCKTNGKAHGDFVSSVARSSLGKKHHE